MERIYRSGLVYEKSQFWYSKRRPRKGRRKGSSNAKKLDRNMEQTVREFARRLNCNFTKEDVFLTLSFDEDSLPADATEALRLVKLFMKRLRTWLQKLGLSARMAWILSDKTKKGDPERLHVHMVVGGEIFEKVWTTSGLELLIAGKNIRDIWKYGLTYAEALRDQKDYTQLASYMIKQAVSGADVKKYHVSQGLDQPVIVSEKIIDKPHELRAPAGAEVLEVSEYDIETGTQYMRYIPAEKKERRYQGFDWKNGPYARDLLKEDET